MSSSQPAQSFETSGELVREVKAHIENRTDELRKTNPLVVGARDGTLSKEQLISYLNMLFYGFQNTPVSLVYGYAKAIETGNQALIDFVHDKITEEEGHHNWARQDLKKLGVNRDEYNPMLLGPAVIQLMDYAKEVIDEDPRLFLCYMYAFEYFSILLIPELLSDLAANCNLPRSGMTALAFHEELDIDHSREDEHIMVECLVEPQHAESALRVARRTMDLLDASLRESTEEKPWAAFY